MLRARSRARSLRKSLWITVSASFRSAGRGAAPFFWFVGVAAPEAEPGELLVDTIVVSWIYTG